MKDTDAAWLAGIIDGGASICIAKIKDSRTRLGFSYRPQLLIANTQLSFPPQHIITIEFESRHAGYGDRSGKALTQVITRHTAFVKVIEGKVISAILDNQWDEFNQKRVGN